MFQSTPVTGRNSLEKVTPLPNQVIPEGGGFQPESVFDLMNMRDPDSDPDGRDSSAMAARQYVEKSAGFARWIRAAGPPSTL